MFSSEHITESTWKLTHYQKNVLIAKCC